MPQPGISASGGQVASRLGQWSWALFEGARNPHVLLITIYIFAPYFYRQLVGDPVHGQSLWGDLNSLAGLIIAIIAGVFGFGGVGEAELTQALAVLADAIDG